MIPAVGSRWRLNGFDYAVIEQLDLNAPWFKLAYNCQCNIDHIKPELVDQFRCPGCVRTISPGMECESTIIVELAWFERRAKEIK